MGSVSDEEPIKVSTGDVINNTAEGNDKDIKVNIDEAACVGIVGTGTYGRALASRLEASGQPVIVGSREPRASLSLWTQHCKRV